MFLNNKKLYVLIEGNENIKQFKKALNHFNEQIRKQCKLYFGYDLPKLDIVYMKTHEANLITTLGSNDVIFLIYPKSMTKFKKQFNTVLVEESNFTNIYIKPTYLSCLYMDKNTKTVGKTNRNNFKKSILEVLLSAYGLDEENKSLNNLKGNFVYHTQQYGNDTFNTILKTSELLPTFNTILKNSNYIACDTEFFNIADNVINTNIKVFLRTMTFSMLEECPDGIKHHTFEFGIEEHLDFTNESRYKDYQKYVDELKKLVRDILISDKTLFMHNVSADLHLLAKFSNTEIYECKEIVDTITSHFVDSPHTPKGLKTIIHETDCLFYEYDKSLNGRYNMTEEELISKTNRLLPEVKEKINEIGISNCNYKWIFLPLVDLLQYNAVDSFVTLNLGIKYLFKQGINRFFYEHQIKFITLPFLQVERNGLPIDEKVLDKSIEFCQQGIEEYKYKLANLGIVKYYAIKKTLTKNNTILKDKILKKNTFLQKRGLPTTAWRDYKTTRKYKHEIDNLIYQVGVCKDLLKELKGNLVDTVELDLPVFIEPFNFSSYPQKVDLFYNFLNLEELLLFSDEDFHDKVMRKLSEDNPNIHRLLLDIKQQQNRLRDRLGLQEKYDFTKLFDQMKYISTKCNVLEYSVLEKKTDENVLGAILKNFDDAPEKSKKGLLYKLALYIQSAAKITKTKNTYLGNYKSTIKFNTVLNQKTTHTSFMHVTRTSRQSSGKGGVNFQNVTDSKRLPKRYAHLKPYVATIKKCVKFNHTYFSSAVNDNIDWKEGKFDFYDFNTILKKHGSERVLIEFDYSQIELYIIALLGNVKYMLSVIEEGRDLHSMTAALTLGITYEEYMSMSKADKGTTRHDSKTMNFTYSFLGSAGSAQQYAAKVYGIVKPKEFWQGLENKFHSQYNEIRPFAFKAFRKVMETGKINTITGHQRLIKQEHDNFNTILEMWKKDGEPFDILRWCKTIPYNYSGVAMNILRKAVNTQVQGSANSYTALSTGMNYNYIAANKGYSNDIAKTYALENPMPKSVIQHNVVHDAQYVSCEIKDIVATVKTYNEVMTKQVKKYVYDNFAFETNIPLRIGLSIGDSWYNMLDFELEPILNDGKLFVAP